MCAGAAGSTSGRCSMERAKSPTSVTVYVAVCILGISGWLPMRVLWVEVPVLRQAVPEAGALPLYLLVLMETTTVATVAYLLARRCCTPRLSEVPVIYSSLVLGVTSLLVLGCFWQHTTPIRGEPHSFVLLISALLAAVVSSVATVTFIPFAARLNPQYMTAMLLGETLASLLPHLMLLAQGGSRSPPCAVATDPPLKDTSFFDLQGSAMQYFMRSSTLPPDLPVPLRFTVGIYFFIHAALVLLSALCFIALRWSRRCRLEYRHPPVEHMNVAVGAGDVELSGTDEGDDVWQTQCDGAYMLDDGSFSQTRLYHQQHTMPNCDSTHQQHATPTHSTLDHVPKNRTSSTTASSAQPASNRVHITTASVASEATESNPDGPASVINLPADSAYARPRSFKVLLAITLWTGAIMAGPLSSIKSYACYPVGNNAFMLGALATDTAAVVACVVAARCLSSGRSQVTIVIALTCLGTILLTYFVALITFSHETQAHSSPLFGSAGELLAVSDNTSLSTGKQIHILLNVGFTICPLIHMCVKNKNSSVAFH